MSETRDTSDTDVDTSEILMDLGPLLDNDTDTEDFGHAPLLPKMRPTSKRRPWVVLLIVVLLVVLIGAGIFTYLTATRPPAVQYTQSAATTGNLAVTVSATGPVEPNAVYNMNFAASGQIATINVKVGQKVKKGQLLATLNSTSLQDAVNQAKAAVTSAQSSVNSAEDSLGNTEAQQGTSLNIASINEQNALNACTNPSSNSGGSAGTGGTGAKATPAPTPTPNPTVVANCEQLAKDQFAQANQQANNSITSASNQVNSAEQQLATAQANLQTAKDNLTEANLTAPHSAVVESINGLVGETAGSGSSSSGSSSGSSSFITLLDNSSLSVAAQVNEADIANVSVNQPAKFTVAAYPSQTFLASVSSIDTQGSTSSSVVTYLVNLAVNMPSVGKSHVYPGMTATVSITTAERIGTLLVPSAALSFSTTAIQNGELTRAQLTSLISGASTSGSTTGSRGIVVELKQGKLVPVLVTTGLTNGTDTEILSGLQAGDEVVISQTGGRTTTTTGTGTGTGTGGFGGGGFGGGGGGGFGGGRGGGGGNGG